MFIYCYYYELLLILTYFFVFLLLFTIIYLLSSDVVMWCRDSMVAALGWLEAAPLRPVAALCGC